MFRSIGGPWLIAREQFRGISSEEGVFSVRDGRLSMAGCFLEQVWAEEVLFYSQIFMMALIWGRGPPWRFLNAHFSAAVVEDGGGGASCGTCCIYELTVHFLCEFDFHSAASWSLRCTMIEKIKGVHKEEKWPQNGVKWPRNIWSLLGF